MIILSESDVTRGLSHTSRHLDPEGTGTRVLWGRWEGVQVGIDPPAAWHGLCPWGHWSAGSASCPRPHRSYLRSVRSLQAASEATLVVAPDRPLRQPDPCAFPATHAVHGFCCWSHRRSEWAPWGLRGGRCSRGNWVGLGDWKGALCPRAAVRFEPPGGGRCLAGGPQVLGEERSFPGDDGAGGPEPRRSWVGVTLLWPGGSAWRPRGGQG